MTVSILIVLIIGILIGYEIRVQEEMGRDE